MGLNTAAGSGVTALSNRASITAGTTGMGVIVGVYEKSGVRVMVGVSVIVGVSVMVGVSVIVGVTLRVGLGAK